MATTKKLTSFDEAVAELRRRELEYDPEFSTGGVAPVQYYDNGVLKSVAKNTQAGAGGDPYFSYVPEPSGSFLGGLWSGAIKPLLPLAATALGANFIAGNMGGALSGLGGGETAGLAADGGMFGLPTAASAGGVSAGTVGTGAASTLAELGGEGFWEAGSYGAGGMSGGGAGTVGALESGYEGMNAASFLPSVLGENGSPAIGSGLAKILSGEGGMQDLLGLLGPAMGIYSGIEGLDRAKDMTNLVGDDVTAALGQLGGASINPATTGLDASVVSGADPWGASGGRALADEQLQALMRSPGSLMTDPGYQARMMGVDRVMAAQGQLGGGGGAVAAANASGDYYDQRLRSLAALEDMGNPVGAQQVGLQSGMQNLEAQKAAANLDATKAGYGLDAAKLKLAAAGGANTLAGQSLASIGYGVTQATGGDTMMSQAQQFLRSLRASGATI